MKLATYRDGSRDGQLVVVSRDLSLAHYAGSLATRLQQVLDDWNFLSPQLEDLSATLNGGKARHAFAFDPACCLAPLPRAYQWALAAGAQGAAPLQRASDELLGPGEDAWLPPARPGAALQVGAAVVTGDIPRGAPRAQALERVRLVLLAHAWCLAGCAAQPAGVFAPLAVTPDELGPAWRDGQLQLPVRTTVRASPGHGGPGFTLPHTPGTDFGELLSALASVRSVRAGSIVGPHGEAAGAPPATACGQVASEAPARSWQDGDLVHSEVTGSDGLSVFGAIAQRVVLAGEPGGAP